ncbi:RNA-binding protein [Angomonas deanei]|uniref:RNA recognition motif. (A.k.a. RRM, RBD, or RNP domain), putative n=1 Tax=Angomonas deanei TaxID=59799 RepID=S9UPH3_9TRYP|nr:RNA-binding protein [Angomonas deanei]EPY30649.1 RNA-binding protein [Angomonas deanei]CAD2216823.1 RNA recognition motif. (a.k.a. RRM, RBD, or RNP domain), putative [Angomonas deanei]|eukprot:EPY27263.1 RNA-binding protein [Angomonas deanei]
MEEYTSKPEDNTLDTNAHVEKDEERGGRSNQGTILFVGNLPFSTPWQNVKDHFKQAGKVRYTDLIADRHGRPKGSALVTMMNEEGAANAIQMFNETEFEGRRLIVRLFDDGPRPALVERGMTPPYNYRRTQYPNHSGNTGGNYYGGYQQDSPMPQGYPMGYDADMSAPRPRSQQLSETGRRLFVSNLPYDCNAVALRETFQQVGEVERAEIIMTRGGKSRGLGIVVMKSPHEANTAIREFDGIEMASRAMKVRFDNKDM